MSAAEPLLSVYVFLAWAGTALPFYERKLLACPCNYKKGLNIYILSKQGDHDDVNKESRRNFACVCM